MGLLEEVGLNVSREFLSRCKHDYLILGVSEVARVMDVSKYKRFD